MLLLNSLSLLFKESLSLIEIEKRVKDEPKEPGERVVYVCKFCKTKITTPEFEIPIMGKHLHLCANPHGILFEIMCFSRGWNYMRVGSPTEEFTWFSGYRWQIIVCSSCLNHLGWEYSSTSDKFLGLIRAHIQLLSSEEL